MAIGVDSSTLFGRMNGRILRRRQLDMNDSTLSACLADGHAP